MAIAERELTAKRNEILPAPEETDDEWTLAEYLEDRGIVLPPQPVTFEEYLEWGLKHEISAEWVEGYIEVRMSASRWHQEIVLLISVLFAFYKARHGGIVLTGPYVMRLQPGVKIKKANKKGSGREPDVLFVSPENERRVQETFLDGPADLVVEVISPESQRRDRNDKLFEYEKAGVREYWLIDPKALEEEFYRRDEATGKFFRVPLENGSVFRSAVMPGFILDVTLLRQRPLPTADVALKSAGLL